jgi:hypothetical protein
VRLSRLAEDFDTIFGGLRRVHGRYVVPSDAKPDGNGKILGKAWTQHSDLTIQDFENHLSGKPITTMKGDETIVGTIGIGVCPIDDDSNCVFGAIDVDVYPLDLRKLQKAVHDLELPLVICRTKSGGAHLYLFLSEPTPAELVRGRLMEWAVALGYPGVEVFPKQTKLASKNDEGNWINLPYQGGARSTRYALHADGSAMSPEEFVATAYASAISSTLLAQIQMPEEQLAEQEFLDGPPCLQALAQKGFGDWQNHGLFNVAVYLRKKHGDGWSKHLQAYNEKLMSPPVGTRDVASTIKSVSRKTYSFMCKQEPICGVCNKQVCQTRQFGIGKGTADDPGVVFGALIKIKTDPPMWIWDVNGARIEVSTDDLHDQRKFHKLVTNKIDKWPKFVKPSVWHDIVTTCLDKVESMAVPEDATRGGQLWVQLARFCTSKARGKSMDELLLGKPYTEDRRTYFAAADFLQYLQQHRVTGINEKELFRLLRERGVDHHFKMLKGKEIICWSVPAFKEQTEEHSVPRTPQEEPM